MYLDGRATCDEIHLEGPQRLQLRVGIRRRQRRRRRRRRRRRVQQERRKPGEPCEERQGHQPRKCRAASGQPAARERCGGPAAIRAQQRRLERRSDRQRRHRRAWEKAGPQPAEEDREGGKALSEYSMRASMKEGQPGGSSEPPYPPNLRISLRKTPELFGQIARSRSLAHTRSRQRGGRAGSPAHGLLPDGRRSRRHRGRRCALPGRAVHPGRSHRMAWRRRRRVLLRPRLTRAAQRA